MLNQGGSFKWVGLARFFWLLYMTGKDGDYFHLLVRRAFSSICLSSPGMDAIFRLLTSYFFLLLFLSIECEITNAMAIRFHLVTFRSFGINWRIIGR